MQRERINCRAITMDMRLNVQGRVAVTASGQSCISEIAVIIWRDVAGTNMKVERLKYIIWAADMDRAVSFYTQVFDGAGSPRRGGFGVPPRGGP